MKISLSQTTVIAHTLSAILISAIVYIFDKEIGLSIFFASVAFNLYIRMLNLHFNSLEIPVNTNDEEINIEPNPIVKLISGLRTIITAAILAILILKFKINLIGVAVAFLLYQLILVGISIYGPHNRRDSRQDS